MHNVPRRTASPMHALAYAGLAVTAGLFALTLTTLDARRRDLDQATLKVRELKVATARQEAALHALETQLARQREHDLELHRTRESSDALVARLGEAQTHGAARTEALIRELDVRLRTLRQTLDAQAVELERARIAADPTRVRREIVLPTVRVNAKSEVGSGTLVWSGARGGKLRAYVLTAWHIVKDNAPTAAAAATSIELSLYDDSKKVRQVEAKIVQKHEPLDLALLEADLDAPVAVVARLATARAAERATTFARVYAVGCPLGYTPLQTSGEITSKEKELDGSIYWMVNAPTIFGNSGGGIYLAESRELVGVLSRISAYKNLIDVAVPHMGIVTPITAVYEWLGTTDFAFIHRDAENAARELPASQKKD